MDLDVIHSPWAVRKELLPRIAALLTGRLAGDQPSALPNEGGEPEAALGRGTSMSASVAVIPLQGLILPKTSLLSMIFGGGGGLQLFRAQLREALSSDDVGSILINVDSPGGRLDLVTETAADIRAAAEQKPVVAVANTMAASAAYWLASQANELVVTPSGQVGSVGVYAVHEDWSKYEEELGIDVTLISAGKYKTEGNPFEPLGEEAKEAIQARVNEGYEQFVADVAKGRGTTPKAVRSDFGEGRMLGPKDAVKQKMADRVDTLEGTLLRMARGGRRSAGSGRQGLQFTDHIASVVAEVDEVIDRAADVVAKRAEKGKEIGEESKDQLAELAARIDRVRGVIALGPATNDDDIAAAAEQEFLRTVRHRVA